MRKLHGMSKTITYKTWLQMIQRCNNPNSSGYKFYKGKIEDQRWLEFENFLADMGERPDKNHSIERVDNDKGYCKENCIWLTNKDQSRNKRNSITNKEAFRNKILQCLKDNSNITRLEISNKLNTSRSSVSRAMIMMGMRKRFRTDYSKVAEDIKVFPFCLLIERSKRLNISSSELAVYMQEHGLDGHNI